MKRAIYVGQPIESANYYVGYGQTGNAIRVGGCRNAYYFTPDGAEDTRIIKRGDLNLYFPES